MKISIAISYKFAMYALIMLHSVFFTNLLIAKIDSTSNVSDSLSTVKIDSLSNVSDSLSSTSSASITFYAPNQYHGLITHNHDDLINKKELVNIEYHSFSELLNETTLGYPIYLGSPGLFNSTSYFGASPQGLSFNFNGRPLSDFEIGSYNPEKLSTEFFENLEILHGSESVIMTDNSTGSSINVQEIIYNTAIPYTKLWFSQNSEDYLSADAIISQNVMPNTNFTFGFRRQFGFAFNDNSKVDNWNVRSIFRWNPSDETSISLTEYFTHYRSGINGGVDWNFTDEVYLFEKSQAVVNYSNFSVEQFTHDLTLTATHKFSNSSKLKGNVYFSYADKTYNLSENLLHYSSDSSAKHNLYQNYFGTNIRYLHNLTDNLKINSGYDFYRINSNYDKLAFVPQMEAMSNSIYSHVEWNLTNAFGLSGGIKYRNYLDNSFLNFGSKISFSDDNFGNLFVDYSRSHSINPILLDAGIFEQHDLFLLGYRNSFHGLIFNINGFFRTISNKKTFQATSLISNYVDNREILGSGFTVNYVLFDDLYTEMKFYLNYEMSNKGLSYIINPKVYYRIVSGRSTLNLGVEAQILTAFTGENQFSQYYLPTADYLEGNNEIMFDGIKVFAMAKLGDAYVKASLENIFLEDYYYIPIYPNHQMNFRFSVVWSFMD